MFDGDQKAAEQEKHAAGADCHVTHGKLKVMLGRYTQFLQIVLRGTLSRRASSIASANVRACSSEKLSASAPESISGRR
jgi:hypothetical protein